MRARILHLELEPGTAIDEGRLVRGFDVSRTPVREALIRLSSDGLVVLLPNRGARVASVPVSDLPQIFEALELSQRITIRWAALRRRPEDLDQMTRFHEDFARCADRKDFDGMSEANRRFPSAIGAACGNRYVAHFYESQLSNSLRLAQLAFAEAPLSGKPYRLYYDKVVEHHQQMIDAIRKRKAGAADAMAQEHANAVPRKSSAGSDPLFRSHHARAGALQSAGDRGGVAVKSP